MNTIEAIIALMGHKRVRRPSWPANLYFMVDSKREEIREFANGKDCGTARFSSGDLLAADWEVLKTEDLPCLDRPDLSEEFLC